MTISVRLGGKTHEAAEEGWRETASCGKQRLWWPKGMMRATMRESVVSREAEQF